MRIHIQIKDQIGTGIHYIMCYSIDQGMVRVRKVETTTDAEGCVNKILFKPFILLAKT